MNRFSSQIQFILEKTTHGMLLLLSLGIGSSSICSPVLAAKDETSLSLELRHPIDKGYWFQKDGRSSVYFYWRQKGLEKTQKIIKIARKCNFSKENLLFTAPLVKRPFRWNTDYTGHICWQISIQDNGGNEILSSENRELEILADSRPVASKSFQKKPRNSVWPVKEELRVFQFQASNESIFSHSLTAAFSKQKTGPYYWKVGIKLRDSLPIAYSEVELVQVSTYGLEESFESESPADEKTLARKAELPSLNDFEIKIAKVDKIPHQQEVGQKLFLQVPPQEAPPLPLEPTPEAAFNLVKDDSIKFSWNKSKKEQVTEIQIGRDKFFSSFYNETVLDDAYLFVPAPGIYFWRLRVFSPDGNYSPWSEIRQFTVDQVQNELVLLHPKPHAKLRGFMVEFAWQAHPSCLSYQVVLSQVDSFSPILNTLKSSTPKYEFEIGDEGVYYWFVLCEQNQGQLKSSIHKFEVTAEPD